MGKLVCGMRVAFVATMFPMNTPIQEAGMYVV